MNNLLAALLIAATISAAIMLLRPDGYTPAGYAYYCPHPASEVEAARDLVTIVPATYRQTREICGPDAAGCYQPLGRVVRYYDGLSDKARGDVIEHELCHAYRIHVIGFDAHDESEHRGWLTSKR